MDDQNKKPGGVLGWIETVGNRLPDPTTLFLVGTIVVMVFSHLAFVNDWTVYEKLPQQVEGQQELIWEATGKEYQAKSLLTKDGLYWLIKNLVDNFMAFPPLGVVLVGMLGIGVAERTGMIAALLKGFMLLVPNFLLTPAMILLGILSSMTLDAGYVVLPPLACALYKAVGRSPLAGLAAVFAGVSAGFNANFFITSLDPMLAEFTAIGAQVIQPDYEINPACNYYFMIASTVILTLVGWVVSDRVIETRLKAKLPEEGGPQMVSMEELKEQQLKPIEIKGLGFAAVTLLVLGGFFLMMVFWEGGFLSGKDIDFPSGKEKLFERWVMAIVPLLFFVFIIPGIVYGFVVGSLKGEKDIAKLMTESMASMAPILVLAFFAAQFISGFSYSGMDKMLAMWGGQALGQSGLPNSILIIMFIFVTMFFNLFVGSMSAKYAMFAPIFVPMLMLVGISPELTQCAYRIGDSVTNIITPLNPYLIIILVFIQKYIPKAGMGTLIATMVPYTVVFTIVWIIMLLIWMALGIPLGPDGGLTFKV